MLEKFSTLKNGLVAMIVSILIVSIAYQDVRVTGKWEDCIELNDVTNEPIAIDGNCNLTNHPIEFNKPRDIVLLELYNAAPPDPYKTELENSYQFGDCKFKAYSTCEDDEPALVISTDNGKKTMKYPIYIQLSEDQLQISSSPTSELSEKCKSSVFYDEQQPDGFLLNQESRGFSALMMLNVELPPWMGKIEPGVPKDDPTSTSTETSHSTTLITTEEPKAESSSSTSTETETSPSTAFITTETPTEASSSTSTETETSPSTTLITTEEPKVESSSSTSTSTEISSSTSTSTETSPSTTLITTEEPKTESSSSTGVRTTHAVVEPTDKPKPESSSTEVPETNSTQSSAINSTEIAKTSKISTTSPPKVTKSNAPLLIMGFLIFLTGIIVNAIIIILILTKRIFAPPGEEKVKKPPVELVPW